MAKFKVGDRVRATAHTAWYALGSVGTVKEDNSRAPWVDWDGIGTWAASEDELELLPAADATGKPALTIEAGKFYRTRDGRKVGPMDEGVAGRFRERIGDERYWDVGGIGQFRANGEDLIAEWVDEPASNDNQPVAEQQEGSVFIDVSKAGPSQLHLAKGRLVKINQGYGFELARYGDYVWVDTGKKQPVVAHINEIKEAA